MLSGASILLAPHENTNLTLQHAMLGTGGIEAEDSIKCRSIGARPEMLIRGVRSLNRSIQNQKPNHGRPNNSIDLCSKFGSLPPRKYNSN